MPTKAAVQLRETRLEDYPAVAALEASQGLKTKPLEEWLRLWTGNPCFARLGPDWPKGWVLENGEGRVVGSIGNLPLPYVFRGRELLVATGRGWAVEEAYRGFALLLMDQYFDQPKVDVFLNTTLNRNAEEAFNTFGSVKVPAGDWSTAAFLVTGARGFAESALRIKAIPRPELLRYPAGAALWIHDLVRSRGIPRSGIEVSPAGGFDARFDRFWETLSSGHPALLAVRGSAALNWHFASALARNDLWIFTAADAGGELQAYGIFERRDEIQYRLRRMRLVDFQALSTPSDYAAAILRRAVTECKERGIHVLENVGCGLPGTQVFERCAPHRRKLPAWCYYYRTPNPRLAEQLADPSAWAPSSFDGDSSL